jgi:hypothetical protein
VSQTSGGIGSTRPGAGGSDWAGSDSGGSSSGAGNGDAIVCHPDPGLPSTAPELSTTLWTNLSPPEFPFNDSSAATGLAFSPCNPSVLYLCTGSFDPAYGGLYRSEDAGTTWAKVGRVPPIDSGGDHLEGPNHVRVDPSDPRHVYAVEGVRGGTQGFWVSTDGGDSFTMPDGFRDLPATHDNFFHFDLYDIAVDPTDFSHILLSHHSAWGWTDTKWNTNSGVLESTDGGNSWIVHEPLEGWGTGHAVNFLFEPALGIGNRDTWLLGTQGNGMWRTTDAGKNWTQVTTNAIQHGGGTIYYDKTGVLYASGTPHNLRSIDNGEHWTEVCATAGYTAVFGDGKQLYTRALFNMGPFLVSPEGGDGTTWTDFSTQQLSDGPFEMTHDKTNGILYSSTWGAGLWALKVE